MLEGLDGAGTTTQAGELGRRLVAKGLEVVTTAEPSRGPIGSLVRGILAKRLIGPEGRPFDRGALALLFAADRLDHVASEVVPALARGAWVVCDRYVLSSLAYQTLDLPEAFVQSINDRAPAPDLTLFLDVPAEVALRRRRAERTQAELFEELPLQRKVAQAYQRAVAGAKVGSPVEVVDGTSSIAAVADAIEATVSSHFRQDRSTGERQATGRSRRGQGIRPTVARPGRAG
ncbi:MAG: dTMP kinase [Deltaproteobacteria bacterium]